MPGWIRASDSLDALKALSGLVRTPLNSSCFLFSFRLTLLRGGFSSSSYMPSVMFAIYIDGIYYANRGVYVDDATTINCEYSLNEEVLSHYDPNFVKGL